MCGLVGIMGEPSNDLTKAFNDMLQMDVIRGWDGTGVISGGMDGIWRWDKCDTTPQALMTKDDYKITVGPRIGIQNKFLLMGHNRAATKGSVSYENSHPFYHKPVLLTHNGTIHNLFPLRKGMEDKYDTDSETVTKAIAMNGIDWVWKNLDGAATIAYLNTEFGTLNLITNGRRPLFFATSKDNKYMLYASESWMIYAVCHRHKIDISESKVKVATPHKLYTWEYDEKKKEVSSTNKVLEDWSVSHPITGLDGRPIGHQLKDYGHGYYHNHYGNRSYGFGWPRKKEPVRDAAAAHIAVRQKDIDEKQFNAKYKNCYFCRETLDGEYSEAVILNDREASCSGCSDIADVDNISVFHAI